MALKVVDHELYEAWLESHNQIQESNRRTKDGRYVVLGGAERLCDAKTGVCLAIVYRNPDLEGQQVTADFWKAVRRCTCEIPRLDPLHDELRCRRCGGLLGKP